jgi:hypothetical protein
MDSKSSKISEYPINLSTYKDNLISPKYIKLFFFGCWNEPNCQDSNIPLYKIIDYIKQYRQYYSLGIINGDNIYPDTKTNPLDKIEKGFNCLNSIELPLYVTLGNNDMNDDKCLNIKKELEFNKDNINILDTGYLKLNTNLSDSHFLFINTNLVKNYSNPELALCYKNLSEIEYNDLKNKMYENLKKKLKYIYDINNSSSVPQHIFIVGHNPLVGIKQKDNITNLLYLEEMKDITKILLESPFKFIYYLAADIHNSQDLTLKYGDKTINIIISGTGGATPDIIQNFQTISKNYKYKLDTYDLDISINNYFEPYGFTDVTIDSTVHINYVKIIDIPADSTQKLSKPPLPNTADPKLIGGASYYSKYIFYKNKYIELKNN